ncbi:MAG: hypothetical protein ACRCV9_16395 [Burkholderiaceae bacterium]
MKTYIVKPGHCLVNNKGERCMGGDSIELTDADAENFENLVDLKPENEAGASTATPEDGNT